MSTGIRPVVAMLLGLGLVALGFGWSAEQWCRSGC